MNEIVKIENAFCSKIETPLKNVDNATLRKMLSETLQITVHHLRQLAEIWQELERRGEDLSAIRSGIMAYLPLIASGHVEPRLVVNYAGQQTLLRALSTLPIDIQQDLAESGSVTIAVVDQGSFSESIPVSLSDIKAAEIPIVFGDGYIRPIPEQLKIIASKKAKAPAHVKPPRRSRRVKVDADRGCLVVGQGAADLDRVVSALSEYYGIELASMINNSVAASAEQEGFIGAEASKALLDAIE